MFQIVEALTSTATRFADQYGATAVVVVLSVLATGVALRLLYRATSGGGQQG